MEDGDIITEDGTAYKLIEVEMDAKNAARAFAKDHPCIEEINVLTVNFDDAESFGAKQRERTSRKTDTRLTSSTSKVVAESYKFVAR